jgi:hypothetical protein
VRAARAVLEAEALHFVAEFRERGGGGSSGQAATDNNDVKLAFVRGVDELQVEFVLVPLLRYGAQRNF